MPVYSFLWEYVFVLGCLWKFKANQVEVDTLNPNRLQYLCVKHDILDYSENIVV